MSEIMAQVIEACIIACMIVALCAFVYAFGAWLGKKISGNRLQGYRPTLKVAPPNKLPSTGSSVTNVECTLIRFIRCKGCKEYYEYEGWNRSTGESCKAHECRVLKTDLGQNGFCSLGNPRAIPPDSEEN